MDEFTTDAFANRGDPVPLLTVTYDDLETSSSEADSSSKRERLKKKLSGQRLREKTSDILARQAEKAESSPSGRLSIQDRLFSKLLQQVIPVEDLDETSESEKPRLDRRSSNYVKRPAFSLPMMTNNFRRFNARIGIVFVFQNRMIRLFTWRAPTHTLSFLAVYTFICFDPYLLIVLPLTVALLFIMVPAFIARHPPSPPQARSVVSHQSDSYSGPPIAPARTIRPAAETSKDFFRNMRDLQNSMADFSNIHDVLVATIAPLTNFSDEVLSSAVFLYMFLAALALFIAAHLLPLRFTFLLVGYLLVISGHPSAQEWLAKQKKRAEKKATQLSDDKQRKTMFNLPVPNNAITRNIQSLLSSFSEITLSQSPERREVEIFELQHRPLLPPGNTKFLTTEWSPHLFSPVPFDPLSPARIAGSRPTGTRFFEDVVPPPGWEWDSKKWGLDLEAGEWVNERLIVGVEYDVVNRDDEGDGYDLASPGSDQGRKFTVNADFGGWVWDLPPVVDKSNLNRDEEVWLAYGDYNMPDLSKKDKKEKKKRPEHRRGVSSTDARDWEETASFGNRGRTGEWRRRRWVRVVRRKELTAHEEK